MTKMKRGASYARYSTKSQSRYSVEDQHTANENYMRDSGITPLYRFSDVAKTGRTAKPRDGLTDLLEAARAGKLDAVVLEAVDRVARNLRISSMFWQMMEHHNVVIHTIAGPADPMFFNLNSLLAEQYSRDASVRTRGRQIRRLEDVGRAAARPYGYKAVPGSGLNRAVDEDEAEIIRRIHHEFVDGLSPRQIASRLNAEAIPDPRGRLWCDNTIRGHEKRQTGILRNPMYRGLLCYGRVKFSIDPETETRKSHPTNSAAITTKEVPELRIVDDGLADAARKRLQDTGFKMKLDDSGQPLNRARRKKYVLSGLIYCACCGQNYSMHSKDRYYCSKYKNKGAPSCKNSMSIRRPVVEERVLRCIKQRLICPDLVQRFVGEALSAWNFAQKARKRDSAGLQRKLDNTKRGIANLVEMVKEGGHRFQSVLDELAKLEQEKSRLDALIASAESNRPIVTPLPNLADAYARQVQKLEEVLRDPLYVERAHEALSMLIDKIVLDPNPDAPDGMSITVHGDLAKILSTCAAAGSAHLPEGFFGGASQVSVVAGARNTFGRLHVRYGLLPTASAM